MSGNRLADYLEHIRQAAADACTYVEGMTRADFLADKRTQQAVVMNLIVIGEAAAKLLQEHGDFAGQHGEIPWRNMKGMRNRIAHGYFEINLDMLWETTQTALPDLLRSLP
jgi:uncharacterized protein with HEPN domain